MKKQLKTFLTTLFAVVGLCSATAAFGTAVLPYKAFAQTQQAVTSNPIIQTTVLGEIDVSSLKMEEGAAVRLKDLNQPDSEIGSRNGLRFTALFNKNIYNKLEELDDAYDEVSVSYGMLIVPYDYITGYSPVTVETIFGENAKYYIDGVTEKKDGLKKIGGWQHIDLPEEDGDTREKEVYCSIINISKTQLTRQFVGVAYVQYIENGVAQYYMTEVEDANARSMVYVAQKAIQDTTSSKKPTDDQKTWLKNNYTTYSDSNVTIPTKAYRYSVNHIQVDPLGNETVVASSVSETKTALYSGEKGNYTANTVEVDSANAYEGYTLDGERSVTKDIIYANDMTALNYYYNQDHCDIQFTGTKCTMKIAGKEGAHLSYVALDGATSFSFSIVPDVGYSSGTVTVTVDGNSVTADANGLYTVSLSNKSNGDTIVIKANVKAGTVSDQVFEGTNYDSTGEQSESFLGSIAGWLGFGSLTVDEEAGTITSTGGSLELSGSFIRNALDEGYTHMVCDITVNNRIGTFTKLEMVNGGSTVFYQKVDASTTRTDRIDLTEFEQADGSCASLMFRAYRKFFGSEAVSASATVEMSNIKMYRSEDTAKWKKFNASHEEIQNAYVAYEDGNLVVETMADGTYFEADNTMIGYDLSVGVSMSFAFKYLTAGNNVTSTESKSFFYHFTNIDMEKTSSNLSSCRIDDAGYYHLCIMPETVKAAAAAAKGSDVKFHFGLYHPGTAMIIRSNSGTSLHSTFAEDGTETVHADTWGYPYDHGIYNEFLQVKDKETAKAGVEFNINMYENHTISLEVTADFNFEGFWYGNNYWTGYKAGMHQFKGVDTIYNAETGTTTYWTEIVYTHAYTDKGFNIHWRDETGDGSDKVGTMQLHYTLTSDASVEYYSFVPDTHSAGIEVSESMQDGIKVESLTGVEGTMFTMPVMDTETERTITLTVYATWDFTSLQYGAGDLSGGLNPFAPTQDATSGLYKETVSVTAVFTNGFKIYYTTDALPENVQKATIHVSVYVDNFETGDAEVKTTEVLQTGGWTKFKAENVKANTVFNLPNMPIEESISAYVTSNVPLAGVLSYGTPNLQMISVTSEMVQENVDSETGETTYVTLFSYCNPTEGYEGFCIALNYVGDAFPSDAWVQVQYRFTDFKIKNTENVLYTGIFEYEDDESGEQQATLYSKSTEARFWLDTAGYAEIKGTITSSVELKENVLLYGHGWETAGVIAIKPDDVTDNGDGSWSYSFTYHENLTSGFCIYYTTNENGESFSGTVTLSYQLYTLDDILKRAEKWHVEDGGTAPTFKKNGHVEYGSGVKADGSGYKLYIDSSVFMIALNNGYDTVGIRFASDDLLTAHILNGAGATVQLAKKGIVEYIEFNVKISDLYVKDSNGNWTGELQDLALRFDATEENASQVAVTIEDVVFWNA